MKYKLIVADVDGTVLDSPQETKASPRLARATKKLDEIGVKVCVATARPIFMMQEIITSMKLTDPAIINGGGLIIDPISGREIWSLAIDDDVAAKVVDFLAKKRIEKCDVHDGSEKTTNICRAEELNLKRSIQRLAVLHLEYDDAVNIQNEINRDFPQVTAALVTALKPNLYDLHITNKLATKEHAIYELAKILRVDKSEIIGIGDGPIDTHLFNAVGFKVAMGNAADELKAAADLVIGDVKEDGLAEFFESLAETKGEL